MNGDANRPGLRQLIEQNPSAAIAAMKSFKQEGKNLADQLKRKGDTRLTPEETDVLNRMSKGATRIERARLLRKLRLGGATDDKGNLITDPKEEKKFFKGKTFNFKTGDFMEEEVTDPAKAKRFNLKTTNNQGAGGNLNLVIQLPNGQKFLTANGARIVAEESAPLVAEKLNEER